MELILVDKNQRIYKLDFIVNTGEKGDIKPTDIICVSDAYTHIERLVFPVYLEEGCTIDDIRNKTEDCMRLSYFKIAGQLTTIVEGGDIETIKRDCEYVKTLKKLNS